MNTQRDRGLEPTVAHSGPMPDSIQRVCDEFETACQAGEMPLIEDLLVGWEEPERSKLLSELLIVEVSHVSQAGETLVAQAYESRFPEHSQVVNQVFQQWSAGARPEGTADTPHSLSMAAELGKLRLHAQGGLGMVFRAADRELSREVAVKFIRSDLADDEVSRDRFRLEAEITSRLEHPGVVPVYGLGDTENGELFYAMRFIQGQTLDDSITRFHEIEKLGEEPAADRERRYRELLERFIAVCKTMAYSHNRGIVHRDIKPENVMLGRYGETILIDWGLAMPVGREGVFKHSGEATLMPSSADSSGGSFGGTPAYMSPEQAAGTLELMPASDIYSLGVTLYKILTGEVPFSGTLHELRSQVIRGDFKKPTAVNRSVSKAIEAVCLKAMALAPNDRYETGMDLARDVENFIADAPVSAYKEPVARRLARWGRRHRTLSQTLLAGLLVITLGGVLSTAVFSQLRSRAVALQHSEHQLREESLTVSASFAARTIGDKVDIRLRILEAAAESPEAREFMANVEENLGDPRASEPLQEWIERESAKHEHIDFRSWFICASDGTQVARSPRLKEDGEVFGSLQQNYAYRDYFHGQLSDFKPGPAITEPHVSIAMQSTNGGDLIVVFSTPIRSDDDDGPPIGVIGMSIELGQFAGLDIPLAEGEKVLLVDTRRYYMKLKDSEKKGPSGEGLLLHHPDLKNLATPDEIPHLDRDIVKYMQESSKDDPTQKRLLPSTYLDPVQGSESDRFVAAFAPVVLTARPESDEVRRPDWYVIIQQ